MRVRKRRLARKPVFADWFVELEELLERREAAGARRRGGSRQGLRSPDNKERR